jgi:hypothetical protein
LSGGKPGVPETTSEITRIAGSKVFAFGDSNKFITLFLFIRMLNVV